MVVTNPPNPRSLPELISMEDRGRSAEPSFYFYFFPLPPQNERQRELAIGMKERIKKRRGGGGLYIGAYRLFCHFYHNSLKVRQKLNPTNIAYAKKPVNVQKL